MDFKRVIKEKILSANPLGGGDIGSSYRVKTDSREYFVKRYSFAGTAEAEALGLKAMAESGAVTVPEVLNYDDHFLVLGYISQGPRSRDFQKKLGRQLALMHRRSSAERFGFYQDNFIGSTPQKNEWKDSWTEFFTENRIEYQVKHSGNRDLIECWRRLKPNVPGILSGTEEPPCLIHGDLWGGNVISNPDGDPVLIDPAAYYGHREMELGMTQLFGGFSSDFYSSYDAEFPLKPGWRGRMDLYKLYHVLNHCNMFGGGYCSQAASLMKKYQAL